MPAVYPMSIKSFSGHTDNVDTIFAAHVNDLQNEVSAVEQTVGMNPQTWAGWKAPGNLTIETPPPVSSFQNAKSYKSVADRLNTLQTQVSWLTALQVRAASWGGGNPNWFGPVAIIRCPGQSFPASNGNWRSFIWGHAEYDPVGMFQGGTNIACPHTGWWQISVAIWSSLPVGLDMHHAMGRLELNNREVVGWCSMVEPTSTDAHRMNLNWAGVWSAGQLARVDFYHNPVARGYSVNATATISLTYLRATS